MAKEPKGFYYENTVEVEINGKKHRVNKFEAEALKKKLSKKSK